MASSTLVVKLCIKVDEAIMGLCYIVLRYVLLYHFWCNITVDEEALRRITGFVYHFFFHKKCHKARFLPCVKRHGFCSENAGYP